MISATTEPAINSAVISLDLRNPADWRVPPLRMEEGVYLNAGLFGDTQAGPFAAFYSVTPRETPLQTSPGHGHHCDSWRISIEGTLRMGAQRYPSGAFRFQEAEKLYGADDVSWGDKGGYSIVMMADRRGYGAVAADASLQPMFDESHVKFNDWLGLPAVKPHGGAGLATSLGMPRNGRVDGSFANTASWLIAAPGLKAVTALAGDHATGPVILLLAAEDGVEAMPPLLLNSDLMLAVVGGAARLGEEILETANARLIEAGQSVASIRAQGKLWLAAVIGDRRGIPNAQGNATWARLMSDVAALRAQLSPR